MTKDSCLHLNNILVVPVREKEMFLFKYFYSSKHAGITSLSKSSRAESSTKAQNMLNSQVYKTVQKS